MLYNRLMNISATKFISGCDEGGDKGDRRGVSERSHKRFVNVEPRSVIGLIRIYGREELRHLNVLRPSAYYISIVLDLGFIGFLQNSIVFNYMYFIPVKNKYYNVHKVIRNVLQSTHV